MRVATLLRCAARPSNGGSCPLIGTTSETTSAIATNTELITPESAEGRGIYRRDDADAHRQRRLRLMGLGADAAQPSGRAAGPPA